MAPRSANDVVCVTRALSTRGLRKGEVRMDHDWDREACFNSNLNRRRPSAGM